METFDYSEGSTNTYTIGPRHGLRSCPKCGEPSEIILDGAKYFKYFVSPENPFVQDVWPNLDPYERDHIFMALHPKCAKEWEEIAEFESERDRNED